jgi:xanthine dehydrogenase accessory factor
MEKKILQEAINLKKEKKEFSIVTDLNNSKNYIYQPDQKISKDIELFVDKIHIAFTSRKNGILSDTKIFVENYHKPIHIIVVGAVHIAQYFCEFAKHLNFKITIIDPRGYFASAKRFPEVKVINKWPNEALKEVLIDSNTALIALTHDPKIDDPAIQIALKEKCFYIGALGSKNTHKNRCERLQKSGFSKEILSNIFGPIGIKLGGRSAPEIALSIIAQLVAEIYKKA